MAKLPGFVGPAYVSLSPIADGEDLRNWYIEILESPNAANKVALYPTPGRRALFTVSDVGGRALFDMAGRTHGVMGTGVYELFPSMLTATKRGTVLQDNNPAQITSNGAAGGELAIASGGQVYYLKQSDNTLSAVSGVAALQVGMLDGYFIAFDPIAAKIRLSPLNDSSGSWDPNQYAQRSIAPDPWRAMVTADRLGTREIYLIGEQTGEVWYDAGAFPFPFAPIPGAIFKHGIIAPFSLAAAGPLVLWLSRTSEGAGIVVADRSHDPFPISTGPVNSAISGYQATSTIADAEAVAFQIQGHIWYVLRFPTANATWVYDITTQLWFRMETWNPALNRYEAWKPRVHCHSNGIHLVGDAGTGTLSALDIDTGTEADGSAIRRLRRAPAVINEQRLVPFRRLQLLLESGLGAVSGQGSTPIVMLRTSDDGGKTWSSEKTASAGPIGQYSKRVFWTRLGASRMRMFEVTVSDPIPFRLIDAYLNNTDTGQAA